MNKAPKVLIAGPRESAGAIREALVKVCPGAQPTCLDTAAELGDYLRYAGRYARAPHTLPDLLLTDLTDPKMGFLAVVGKVKAEPALKRIPVLAFCGPAAPEEANLWYGLGINSVIEKPASAEALAEFLQIVCRYWFEHVELPGP